VLGWRWLFGKAQASMWPLVGVGHKCMTMTDGVRVYDGLGLKGGDLVGGTKWWPS
jgi:hypothetical protein